MKIVKKSWGSEEWIVNDIYCGKILNLKKDKYCSVYYHKNKDETFYILNGKVKLELLGKTKIMRIGDVHRLYPGDVHRFIGIEDSKILEISTHHEDDDSYRLIDSCP